MNNDNSSSSNIISLAAKTINLPSCEEKNTYQIIYSENKMEILKHESHCNKSKHKYVCQDEPKKQNFKGRAYALNVLHFR